MARSRWLIAMGAVVLAGMLLCGAFSLGVYAGKHGLSGDTPRTSPEAEPLLRLRDELGQPDLQGRVRRASPQVLDLATSEGPRSVELNGETQFLNERGARMTVADLHPGDPVAVYGDLGVAEARLFIGRLVVRLPIRGTAQP
jgi:hypothetical protein